MIKNRKLSWIIRVVLIVLALIITHGACYLQGMVRANRKVVIRIANDNCFFPLLALQAGGDDERDISSYLVFGSMLIGLGVIAVLIYRQRR